MRAKLVRFREALLAHVGRGRLALGSLLGDQRLRVLADGRIEGTATLAPGGCAPP